ncbi:putative pentatricopeptide repeat-containing protein [Nymphaea thermarum]|nr:putative pentatricopeptide repeat-containing protein [Nymphaea thermarum]
MVEEGFQPDECSFLDILKACSFLSFLELGRKSHASIVKSGYGHTKLVSNALVNMYARSQGGIGYARQLFDEMSDRDSVTWNVMISGFVHSKSYITSLEFFCLMTIGRERPNVITFAIIFPVCVQMGSFTTGLCVHGLAIRMGLVSKTLVGNALVSMYAKFGRSVDACYLFDEILEKDVVSWNATIAGLCENNQYVEARNLFSAMVFRGYMPNSATIVNVLPIYGLLQDRDHGRQIHCYLLRASLDTHVYVNGALLDVYAKCGNIQVASNLFNNSSQPDLVMFTAMIGGLAMHGRSEEAVKIFDQMLQAEIKPDHVAMTAILSACSHGGLLDKGRKYFESMSDAFGIKPTIEHYACMADLLARSGCLKEAYEFVSNMPCEANANVWGTLLGACKMHHNVALGQVAGYHLFNVEAGNIGNYVLLSNIYAADRRWDRVEDLRKMMKQKDLKKPAGCSWIERKMLGKKGTTMFVSQPILEMSLFAKVCALQLAMAINAPITASTIPGMHEPHPGLPAKKEEEEESL